MLRSKGGGGSGRVGESAALETRVVLCAVRGSSGAGAIVGRSAETLADMGVGVIVGVEVFDDDGGCWGRARHPLRCWRMARHPLKCCRKMSALPQSQDL